MQLSVQNLNQHVNVKHVGLARAQDKDTKIDMFRKVDTQEIIQNYIVLGSIAKVLDHYSIGPNSTARAYVAALVKDIAPQKAEWITSTNLEARIEEIRRYAPECPTKVSLLQKLGITRVHEGLYKTLTSVLEKYDITLAERNHRWPSSEVYVKDSNFSRNGLAVRVRKDDFMEYKCQKCENIGEWMGEPLKLQIDHINGDNIDHRKENLRWICPNCHSQTDTFCKGWKNKRAI